MPRWLIFILCLAVPLLVGSTAGFLTRADNTSQWYLTLEKPSFNPPAAVFGPVWTTLYALMGVSLYLIIRREGVDLRTPAILIFIVQLVLNFFWSLIFFKWHQLGGAAAEITVLWAAIVAMVFIFYKISPPAALLQLPYLGWVTFATILTWTIFRLNSGNAG